MYNKSRFKITPLLVLTVFAITSFIYHDFNIRMLAGYGLFLFLGLVFILLSYERIYITRTKVYAIILTAAILVLVLFPSARKEKETLGVVFSFVATMVYIVIARPTRGDVSRTMKILMAAAAVMAVYAILMSLFPDLYYKVVKHIVSAEAQRKIELNFKYKYGIAVGGESIVVDYYAFFGIAISLNTLLIKRKRLERKVPYLLALAVCFAAVVVQNRKSELLTTVVVTAVLILSRINFTSLRRRRKHWLIFIVIAAVCVVAFIYMINHGMLQRYRKFIMDVIANLSGNGKHVDISSGRLKLWKKAWDLFVKNPVFGIGWGNFKLHVTDTYNVFSDGQLSNVHNNYLQILCETGIVGFAIFVVPLLLILFRTFRCVKTYRKSKNRNNEFERIVLSTSVSFQMFYLIISFIDPVWYKMFTWPFYGISVVMLLYAEQNQRNKCTNETGSPGEELAYGNIV